MGAVACRGVLGVSTLAGLGALSACGTGPVELDAPDLSPADATTCRQLLDALPETVADQPRREISPEEALGAAWGDPAITLVCGVGTPAGFDDVAVCTSVNGVDWYLPEEQLEEGGDLTMTAVKRAVYVEVRLPEDYFPPATTLADLAPAITATVPATGTCY